MNKIVCDIGGTSTRLELSEDGQSFTAPIVYPTPENFDQAIEVFSKHVNDLKGNKETIVIAGLPGVVDRKMGGLNRSHLTDWVGKSFVEKVREKTNCQVKVENDAALVALGEATTGAGKGYGIVAYITISTGVGGARIVDGKIDVSHFGFEPGRQIINYEKLSQGFAHATLEGKVSGRALKLKYGAIASQIHEAKLWDEVAMEVAVGLHNVAVFWSPEVIVVGGGLILNSDLSIASVKEKFKALGDDYYFIPEIKKATLGDFGGLAGGLVYN